MDRLKTKALQDIEKRMERLDQGSLRYHVLEGARSFKTSWIDLGRALYEVWKEKLYKQWGYTKFESYTAREIGVRKQTAVKLLKSYYFLEREAPSYLESGFSKGTDAATVPQFEAVDVLRRARDRKDIDEIDYTDLKRKVLDEGREAGSVKKELTALIKQREELEPEEARRKKRLATVRRFLGTLKSLRRDLDLLDLLPGNLIKDTDKLINRIESEIA